MSGAGRSASSNVFEDLGYYVIENLPPDLVESVVESNDVAESNRQLVLTVDARDGFAQDELNKSLDRLSQSGVLTRIIFLDADTETLIERYEENRRPHPMDQESLSQSVTKNRGSSTPSASFGGRTKIRIGTLNEPIAPPKLAFEMETASTESNNNNSGYDNNNNSNNNSNNNNSGYNNSNNNSGYNSNNNRNNNNRGYNI